MLQLTERLALNAVGSSELELKLTVRAYLPHLIPEVLEGRIEPGKVFDLRGGIDLVPDGYRAMNERKAIKMLVEF